jgi:hypothetical protein
MNEREKFTIAAQWTENRALHPKIDLNNENKKYLWINYDYTMMLHNLGCFRLLCDFLHTHQILSPWLATSNKRKKTKRITQQQKVQKNDKINLVLIIFWWIWQFFMGFSQMQKRHLIDHRN